MGFFDDFKDSIQNNLPKIVPDVIKKPLKEVYWDAHNSLRGRNADSETDNNAEIVQELKDIGQTLKTLNTHPETQPDSPLVESIEEYKEAPSEKIEEEIIQSIELKPFPKQGKNDNNQVIVNYSNAETKTHTVTSELFYFLYLLCYQRLNNDKENWVTLKEPIHMIHIAHIEEFMGHKLPRYFSWISTKEQKQTVISKINKNIAPIIYRSDEESDEHGQESYYSLINELKGEKSIVLHKM